MKYAKRVLCSILILLLVLCSTGQCFAYDDNKDLYLDYQGIISLYDDVNKYFPEVDIGPVPSFDQFSRMALEDSSDKTLCVSEVYETMDENDNLVTLYVFDDGSFSMTTIEPLAQTGHGITQQTSGDYTRTYQLYNRTYAHTTYCYVLINLTWNRTVNNTYYFSNPSSSDITVRNVATVSRSLNTSRTAYTFKGDTFYIESYTGAAMYVNAFTLVGTVNSTTGAVSHTYTLTGTTY